MNVISFCHVADMHVNYRMTCGLCICNAGLVDNYYMCQYNQINADLYTLTQMNCPRLGMPSVPLYNSPKLSMPSPQKIWLRLACCSFVLCQEEGIHLSGPQRGAWQMFLISRSTHIIWHLRPKHINFLGSLIIIALLFIAEHPIKYSQS